MLIITEGLHTVSHNVQFNIGHSVTARCSVPQHLVNQPNMFRSLMGSSSGIRITVRFHKNTTSHVCTY
jgi:hypothetical protein